MLIDSFFEFSLFVIFYLLWGWGFFSIILLTKVSFFSLHAYIQIYICIISFRAKFFKSFVDFLNVELCNTDYLYWCLIFLINFYWNIVIFQCCVSLYCTAKWISFIYALCFAFPSGPQRALSRGPWVLTVHVLWL